MTPHMPARPPESARSGRLAQELAPDGAPDARPAIDLVHLARQTLGDGDLELELLGLFARQARSIVATLAKGTPQDGDMPKRAGDLLHTLCGSARAVGAWGVAEEAQSIERDERSPATDRAAAGPDRLATLQARVDRACAVIDNLLDQHP